MRRILNIPVSFIAAGLILLLLLQPVTGLFGRAYGVAGEVVMIATGATETPASGADLRAETEVSAATPTLEPPAATASPAPAGPPPTIRLIDAAASTPSLRTSVSEAVPTAPPDASATSTSTFYVKPSQTPEATSTRTDGSAAGVTASPSPTPTPKPKPISRDLTEPVAIATSSPAPTATATCPLRNAELKLRMETSSAHLTLTNRGEANLEGAALRLTILGHAGRVLQMEITGQTWRPQSEDATREFEIEPVAPGASLNLVLDLLFDSAVADQTEIEIQIELWAPACDAVTDDLLASQSAVFVSPSLKPVEAPADLSLLPVAPGEATAP